MKLHLLSLTTVFTNIAIAVASISPVSATSIYAIGNSLTYDTLPFYLEGSIGYHIGCSKSLQQIYDEPENSACVPPNIGTWDEALSKYQFDFVTVQPYSDTTLKQDLAIINEFITAQPLATFIIHEGWLSQTNFEANTHNSYDEKVKSLTYHSNLINALVEDNPERNIISTRSLEALDSIYHDIKADDAPFSSFDELFRDDIHMNVITGRYLMHNLMRQALGQPFSNPMQLESGEIKTYLDAKINEYGKQQANFMLSKSGWLALGLLAVGGILIIVWQQKDKLKDVKGQQL